jgi:hypothetical protein
LRFSAMRSASSWVEISVSSHLSSVFKLHQNLAKSAPAANSRASQRSRSVGHDRRVAGQHGPAAPAPGCADAVADAGTGISWCATTSGAVGGFFAERFAGCKKGAIQDDGKKTKKIFFFLEKTQKNGPAFWR